MRNESKILPGMPLAAHKKKIPKFMEHIEKIVGNLKSFTIITAEKIYLQYKGYSILQMLTYTCHTVLYDLILKGLILSISFLSNFVNLTGNC